MANRVILGNFNGSYVFRVSRPGYNVGNDALDKKFIAFDSRWNNVSRVIQSGTVVAYQLYIDMLGILWMADIYGLPTNLSMPPVMLFQFKPPHLSDTFASNPTGGSLFGGGGWVPEQGYFGVAAMPSWFLPNQPENVPFGVCKYWAVAP